MKKLVGAIFILAIFVFNGCQSKDNSQNEIKIGVVIYNQNDTFVSAMMTELLEYSEEKQSQTGYTIDIEINNASDSQRIQNEQVESMINNGCDVVCVNLVDRTSPSAIIDMARAADIPVVFFNREPVEEDLARWDKLYYVGADASESGNMQGELIVDYYKEHADIDKNGDGYIQYIVLEGEAGHQDAIIRTESCVKTMEKAGMNLEKLDSEIANWNRAQGQTKMALMLEKHGAGIEVVISNNDDMALGAIDELTQIYSEKNDWPIVVGIDGTEVGLNAVESGAMIGTVYNDKEGQARTILDLAYCLATDGDMSGLDIINEKYIMLPYYKVTAE